MHMFPYGTVPVLTTYMYSLVINCKFSVCNRDTLAITCYMAVERSEIASTIDLLSDTNDHEDNSEPSASKKLKASAKSIDAAKYRFL